MSLTKVEQDICKFAVHRLLDQGEAIRKQTLLKEFKGSLPDALRKLVDRSVFRAIDQNYGSETYLPRPVAFHYCGDPNALTFARKSTEAMLRILLVLYEQELDKEPQEQKQFTPADVKAEASRLEFDLDEKMIRFGLYFADELSVFSTLQKDAKQVFPVTFRPSEQIYEVLKFNNPWDLHIERGRVSVENEYGRSLDRIDISDQPRNLASLPNKEKLIADVNSFLTRKAGLALLVIDLDHFKNVNDTKGHQEGDDCLARVVKVIGSVLGRKGILYRWGGDEFAVALPDFSSKEAHGTAERIRGAVEQSKPGGDLPVTTSIGVSGVDQMTNGSAEDLLNTADKAMYKSKRQGKNRVTSWSVAEGKEENSPTYTQRESQVGPELIRARVEVSLELRRAEINTPREAFIRLDNASEVGVTVTRLTVTGHVNGHKGTPTELPLNVYLGPHLHRELEGSTIIREAVWSAVPQGVNVDGQHEAHVDFGPDYKAGDRNTYSGPHVRYHVEFGGTHFQKATVCRT